MLTTSVRDLPGVDAQQADALVRLDLRCVADLLLRLPMRYEHELPEQQVHEADRALADAHGSRANLAVRGEVMNSQWLPTAGGRRSRVEATLFDGSGTVKLIWFNTPWVREKIHPGLQIAVAGRARRHGDEIQIINPRWSEITPEQQPPARRERYRPVYSAGEELKSWQIERVIHSILEPALAQLDDHLHEEYRRARALPSLAAAYRMAHRPANADEADEGRRRLVFDELLLLQLAVMIKRHHRCDALQAIPLKWSPAVDEHIRARFPFELTNSQRAVVEEIVADLQRDSPMNRLLQGDVGAGKTVVALYGMLMAVASKHQAALMAPTELLAEQHFASITSMLRGGKVTIELLTGSLAPAEKQSILRRLESGAIDILIGTHALLTETVRFKSLALAVIDEQHRFGVHQRAILRAKANDERSSPHVLVMTATPIPRTLSLTLFGDLDVSTIRELPIGRQPIITKLVNRSRANEVYDYMKKRLAHGDQAYVVVPVIEETENDLTDLQTHLKRLQDGPFRDLKIAAVHGRLKADARERIMDHFRNGVIQVLVATTVIEVGVDVPNATIMVVEDADRFGLSQLHQLRGRIGRGIKRSLCVLIAEPKSDEARDRLRAIVNSTDGFEIAERDLEIRGPGELFGTKQSGVAPFRVAKLPRDAELLNLARRDARKWIEENPTLQGDRDALLRKRLLKAHGKMLGLGDVA